MLVVWLLFLFKAVFYASFVPLWEGFDEFSHFGLVQHLAATGHLPKLGSASNSREVSESLNYVPVPWTIRHWRGGWTTQDSFWRLPPVERDRRTRSLFAMPAGWAKIEPSGAPIPLYEAQQPPLAYLTLSVPYRLLGAASLPTRVWGLRIFCSIIASLTIPIGFLAAREVFVNEWHGVGAVLIVSAMPEFLITATRIGNEALAIFLGTVTLYFVTRIAGSGVTRPLASAMALGVTVGCGLLTKAYFLALLPSVTGLYVWLCVTQKRRRRQIATQASITFLFVIVVAGAWYFDAFFRTGSLTGEQQAAAAARSGVGLVESLFQVNWLRVADFALVSHIWLGDWSFLVVRSWMYRTLEVLLLSSAVGLLLRRRNASSFIAAPRYLWIYASFLVTFGCGVAYQALSAYRSAGDARAFGYYAYSIVVAEAVCVLGGVASLAPEGSRQYVIPTITSLFACLEVFGVCFYQMPYYAGFIAHDPRGTVNTLKLSQIGGGGLGVMFRNLAWGKPHFIKANTMLCLWCLFLLGVIGILYMGILTGSRSSHERS